MSMYPTRKKGRMAAVLCVMALLAAMTGCSQPEPSSQSGESGGQDSAGSSSSSASENAPSQTVELEYWYEGAGPERSAIYEARIQEFNDANSDVQVQGVYVPSEDALEKINVAISAGATPDLASMQDAWLASIFAQKACLPLDDYFTAWEEKDQFPAEYIEATRLKAQDGKLYSIPQGSTLSTIWYRKDVFAERGIEPPTTWENFFHAIEQLTYTDDAGQPVYGYSLRGGSGSVQMLVGQLISYVGLPAFFDEAGSAQVLRDPAALEFVQKTAEIYQKGYCPESSLSASYKEMVADFTAGIAMMITHNLGSYENHKAVFTDEQYAAVPYPPSVRGQYTSTLPSVKGIGIFAGTEHPDECWRFIQHFCSAQSISRSNEAIGEIPPRIDALADEWVENAPHLREIVPYVQDENKLSIQSPTVLPDFDSITKNYGEPNFQKVLAGELSAEAFLDEYATQLEEAYQEYVENVGPIQ